MVVSREVDDPIFLLTLPCVLSVMWPCSDLHLLTTWKLVTILCKVHFQSFAREQPLLPKKEKWWKCAVKSRATLSAAAMLHLLMYVCMYVCMRNSTCRLFIEHVSRTNNLGINPVFVRVASAILPEKPYKFLKKISYDWQQKLSWFWKIVLYDYNVDE